MEAYKKTVTGHVPSIKVTFAGCVTSASQDFCVIGGGWNVVYMVGYSEYSALFFDLCVVHLKIGLLQEEAINNEFCFLPRSVATLVIFSPVFPLSLFLQIAHSEWVMVYSMLRRSKHHPSPGCLGIHVWLVQSRGARRHSLHCPAKDATFFSALVPPYDCLCLLLVYAH